MPELVPIMPPLPASEVSVKVVQPPKSSVPPSIGERIVAQAAVLAIFSVPAWITTPP